MYKFYKAESTDYKAWNDFIKEAPNGNFRQTTYWGEIKALTGWLPHYYFVKQNDKIRGVALIQEKKIPYFPISLLYCPNGPVVDWKDNDASKILLGGIKFFAKEKKTVLLRIDPEPVNEEQDQEKNLFEVGFKKIPDRCSQWNRTLYTTRVMLDLEEEILFMQLSRTLRKNVKTAIKNGVVTTFEIKPGDSSLFATLMQGLETRRASLLHVKQYHEKVFENLVENGIGYFLKAELEGQIISGLIVVILGDKAWAVFIANDYAYRKLMPNKLLIWEAIRLSKSLGCRFLDLGATQASADFDPENDPLDSLKNAYRPNVVYYPGYFDFSGLFYQIFRIAEKMIIPNFLKVYVKTKRLTSQV
jgi:peptidoglycan pentaglycine glycine transferase (the first glycine)